MKLRLQGNSVLLRLTRPEVERLRETGLVEVSVDFGAGETLACRQIGALAISIEKDFRCLTRPRDDERDAYPHPGQTLETRS
jgi:hypothetical protein